MMPTLQKAARVAFTFVVMNVAAISGLFALRRRTEIWR
ncbi:hypothetical protein BH23ACI1_BH23ACI1_01370 [soil metagenome]